MYGKSVNAYRDIYIINMRCHGRVNVVYHNHKITKTHNHNLKSHDKSKKIM